MENAMLRNAMPWGMLQGVELVEYLHVRPMYKGLV